MNHLEYSNETETETETESESELENSEVTTDYWNLRQFRDTFEEMLYLMLTDSNELDLQINNIDESFWDPVIVRLDEEIILDIPINTYTKGEDCTICTSKFFHLKQLPCCNNTMCCSCSNSWFSLSVFCPYCKRDIRDLIEVIK